MIALALCSSVPDAADHLFHPLAVMLILFECNLALINYMLSLLRCAQDFLARMSQILSS